MAAMMQEWFNMIAAQPHLETVASGNTADSTAIAHFNSNGQLPLKKCLINLTPSLNGYTSATLDYRGRNLLISIGPPNNSIFTLNADGSITANGTLSGASWFLWNTSVPQVTSSSTQYVQTRLLPNGRYRYPYGDYVDGNHRANSYPIYSLDLSNYDGTNERKGVHAAPDSEYCVTIDDTYKYNWMRIYQSQGNTYSNYTFYPRLFLASENDYSWEPCNWRKFTVTFGRTVYGGVVDLINGTLTVNWVSQTFDGTETWEAEDTRLYRTWISGLETTAKDDNSSILSSYLPSVTRTDLYPGTVTDGICLMNGDRVLVRMQSAVSTLGEWRDYIAANPMKVIYKIATPTVYNITPQAINTLTGVNNVWSDQGLVELAYWTQSRTTTDTDIKDIKVYLNNAAYLGPNGLASNYVEDSRFFIAGPFDTGSEESKTYTFSTCPISTTSGGAAVKLYNDLSANSVDYNAVTRTNTASVTSDLSGRYVLCSVCKSYADTSYMYYTVNGVKHYLFKGSKVT